MQADVQPLSYNVDFSCPFVPILIFFFIDCLYLSLPHTYFDTPRLWYPCKHCELLKEPWVWPCVSLKDFCLWSILICMSLFPFAVINYPDQEQLWGKRVCFALSFRRVPLHGGKAMAAGLEAHLAVSEQRLHFIHTQKGGWGENRKWA